MNPCNVLFFTFFILHFSFVFSQSPKIDSLLSVLKTDKDDTTKVKHLIELYIQYHLLGDYENALQKNNDALKLSQRINYKKGMAVSYGNIGNINYDKGDYDKALEFQFKDLKIAEEIADKKLMTNAYINIGIIYYIKGDYNKSLEFNFKALFIKEELNDKKGMAASYGNIGLIYTGKGDYDKALEFQFKDLKIAEEIADKKLMANAYNNIGNIYRAIGNYDKALEFCIKSFKIEEEFGNKKGMSDSYNSFGQIYDRKGDYDKALEFHFKGLSIKEELNDKKGIAGSYNNIAIIYHKKTDYDKAIGFYTKGYSLLKEFGDKNGMAMCCCNIGRLYLEKVQLANDEKQKGELLTESIKALKLSLVISNEIRSKPILLEGYLALSECDSVISNFKSAYEYHKLYSLYKDSIFNEESSKQMAEMQTRYETEKKEKEIALQKAEIIKKEAVIKQQNIQRIALASGFALMLALAFVVFRAYRNKRKANKIISTQKAEVELQKSVIEEKNKNITDSIEYASYIQQAMLPTDEEFYRLFPEAFILYKPRDIVSGDFYWCSKIGSAKIESSLDYPGNLSCQDNLAKAQPSPNEGEAFMLCTADCTGHGVPGAFMSMLCTALLNEAVNDKGLVKPNEIFEEVRKGIIAALKQRGQVGGSKDGMDAAIISLQFRNVETLHATSLHTKNAMSIHATCANNPVYIISNGSLTEMLSDRFPVGVYEGEPKPFTCHDIEVKKGDMVYTVTDGFEDQLGGEKGKKFKSAKLKELLLVIAPKPVSEQKEILEKAFGGWKGEGEQTDDVTVIGIRV